MSHGLRIRINRIQYDIDLLDDQIKEVVSMMVDLTKNPINDKDLQAKRVNRINTMFKNLLIQKDKLLDPAPQTHKTIQREQEEYACKYVEHHILR